MTSGDLERVALTLVADGKGILAADETIPTLTRRFDTLGIKSSEQSRRTYREMLFLSPGAAEFISGVIMCDEPIRQKSSRGVSLAQALAVQGLLPGIKVTPAQSRLPALVMRPSRRGSMVCGIASRSIGPWAPALRSGALLSVSRTLYQVPPA